MAAPLKPGDTVLVLPATKSLYAGDVASVVELKEKFCKLEFSDGRQMWFERKEIKR